jgi:hypothetical protein
VAIDELTRAEEDSTLETWPQDNADRFLLHQRNHSQAIRSSGHHSQQPLLFGCLQRLYGCMRRVRRDLFDTNSWLLLHDNAPSHFALNVKHFLAKKAITTIEHPPYLPDLAPADYFFVSENQ